MSVEMSDADMGGNKPPAPPATASTASSTSGASTDAAASEFVAQVVACVEAVRRESKADVAQASLKTLSKMLQAIAHRPGDKKLRQHRLDNIIVKKHVVAVPGAMALAKAVGFAETTIEGKQYLSVEEAAPAVAHFEALAEAINAAAAAPLSVPATPAVTATPAPAADVPAVVRALCARGCGFFGDAAQEGMCSKCFKETRATAAAAAAPAAATPNAKTLATAAATARKSERSAKQRLRSAFVKAQALGRFLRGRRPVQEHKDRCWSCQRKLGLSGVECRCGYVFCGKHRYADEHACSYDHAKRHQSTLAQSNQRVAGQKFEKISDD